MARQGKIARFPYLIRERINAELMDNRTAAEILEWVNADEAVRAILADKFEGEPVSPQNLSAWRSGGFADWMENEAVVGSTMKLAELSVQIANADGATIAGGAASITAGKIMQALEGLSPDDSLKFVDAVAKLKGLDLKQQGMAHAAKVKDREHALAERGRDQKDRELDQGETRIAGRLLALAKTDEFLTILRGNEPEDFKIALIRERMFGPVKSQPE